MKTLLFATVIAFFITAGCVGADKYNALEITNQMLSDKYDDATNRAALLEGLVNDLNIQLSNVLTNMAFEISNLEETHRQLTTSLQSEISNGEIEIQRIKGVLTMNIADQIFFDSGQAVVKPEGEKVLMKVADILKKISNKMIRIEGHTDNVAIKSQLTNVFPSNWELAAARAINVVRFLQEKGGIDPSRLSAESFSEYRPLASNKNEKGRARNRRIEIVLTDKDLSQVMNTKKGLDIK